MKEIILYTNPMSRGRTVRWMLEELGVSYQAKILNFTGDMKTPEYLAINPMGKVPAIKHGDIIVTETDAICMYLADVFADKGLAPQTEEEKALYYRWMSFAAGPAELAMSLKMMGVELTHKLQQQLGCGSFQDTENTLIKAVSASKYIAGDRFTAADVYVGSKIDFYLKFNLIEKHSAFIDYCERVCKRPAKLRADEIDNQLIQK